MSLMCDVLLCEEALVDRYKDVLFRIIGMYNAMSMSFVPIEWIANLIHIAMNEHDVHYAVNQKGLDQLELGI